MGVDAVLADAVVGGLVRRLRPGVVMLEVEELEMAGGGEWRLGGVALAGLVGQLGLEADEGSFGAVVGLGDEQPLTLEDSADGGRRGQLLEVLQEVEEDGLGAG